MRNASFVKTSVHPEINDRWLFNGLLLLLVWAPLPLGSNRTWAIGILIAWSQVLLFGALFAWRHAAIEAFARLRRFRWPLGLFGLFVALAWLQLLPMPEGLLAALSAETLKVEQGVAAYHLSLDANQTQLYAALSFAYFSCFLVALLSVRDGRRLDSLAYAIVGAGLLQALVGVVLFSMGASYRIFFFDVLHAEVLGSFGNRNHFAGYMEICLSVGIGLMLARLGSESGDGPARNWRHKLAKVIDFILSPKMRLRMMLVILVIALVLTRSRMGNSGFFAAMLVVGVLAIILSRKMAPATVWLITSLVIIDVVIVGTWVGLEKVVDRVKETGFTQQVGAKEESVELRTDVARHSVDLVREFPTFGTGAGSFYNTYLRYRTPRESYWDHAHNDYVELAADNGLVGLGLLGGFVLLTASAAIRILFRRRSSLPRGIAFGSLMAMVALAIHSTVDFNLQLPANALTLVVVMAMVWMAYELPSGAPASKSRRRRSGRLAAGQGAVPGGV
ncbi:MAG: O-antigen ligase family protein [Bacteroidota bacterium]